MVSAAAVLSSLGAGARFCAAPRRRPAASSSFPLAAPPPRVHLPTAARKAPPQYSLILPALQRPRASGSSEGEDLWGLTYEQLLEFEATALCEDPTKHESKEAVAALKGALAGVLGPLRQLLEDVRNFRNVYDTEEFHIGMPFGAIMTCIGMYQMWKLNPSMCMDIALSYAFYKLSVIAADVRRRGFCPDLIIRIKLVIVIAMIVKDLEKKIVFLDYVRLSIFSIYALSVSWEAKGLKKYSKIFLPMVLDMFKSPAGRRELLDLLVSKSEEDSCQPVG